MCTISQQLQLSTLTKANNRNETGRVYEEKTIIVKTARKKVTKTPSSFMVFVERVQKIQMMMMCGLSKWEKEATIKTAKKKSYTQNVAECRQKKRHFIVKCER